MAKKDCGCETLSNGYEYIYPHCNKHADPCDCEGCAFCDGEERGCTCHIDWDKLYGHE